MLDAHHVQSFWALSLVDSCNFYRAAARLDHSPTLLFLTSEARKLTFQAIKAGVDACSTLRCLVKSTRDLFECQL